MKIVSSTYFLRNLRNLDFFTLDFGKSKKDTNDAFRKVDEFIIKYRNLYNKNIVKFGRIGDKIFFYEDLSMIPEQYIIFKDEDIYEIKFEQDDLLDMENYLLDVLRKIDINEEEEKEQEEKNEQKIIELNGNNFWVAPQSDMKNGGKKYSVDQTLSREEYRKVMREKFITK